MSGAESVHHPNKLFPTCSLFPTAEGGCTLPVEL